MANSPTDTVPSMMRENFGTIYLVTDPRADNYLNGSKREGSKQKKFTDFCGGTGGWDDYSERLSD